MNTYTLSKPITTLTGEVVNELTLDYDVLTLADLKTASKIAKMIAEPSLGNVDNTSVSPRLDANLRIGTAWVAAMRGTKPQLTINDCLQLSMIDAICLSEDALSGYFFR